MAIEKFLRPVNCARNTDCETAIFPQSCGLQHTPKFRHKYLRSMQARLQFVSSNVLGLYLYPEPKAKVRLT